MKTGILALILLFTIITFPACSNDLLWFEEISTNGPHNNFDSSSRWPDIYVLSEVNTPLPDILNEQYWVETLKSIDFTKYFVVFISRGPGYSNEIVKVINIKNEGGTVIVTAGFYTIPSQSVTGELISPAQAIKVSKSKLDDFEQLTFKLVDTEGLERAVTVVHQNR
jgi:hypothetical protein